MTLFKENKLIFKMEYHCKNAFCNATDESRFYKNNRTMCKNCMKQRRDITKKTKQLSDGAPKNSNMDSTVKGIILAQQKMLEHQQRQTDALFSLAEKLLEKVKTVDSSFNTAEMKTPSPNRTKVVSHTPRRRQNLVHYKDRLNNDL